MHCGSGKGGGAAPPSPADDGSMLPPAREGDAADPGIPPNIYLCDVVDSIHEIYSILERFKTAKHGHDHGRKTPLAFAEHHNVTDNENASPRRIQKTFLLFADNRLVDK